MRIRDIYLTRPDYWARFRDIEYNRWSDRLLYSRRIGVLHLSAVVFGLLAAPAIVYAQTDLPPPAASTANATSAEAPSVVSTTTDIPDRELTRSEILEIIATLRREFEELDAQTGDDVPSAEIQQRMLIIGRELIVLHDKLDALDEQRAPETDTSFGAKMERLLYAAQDATRYDVADGMFRIQVGVRLQGDLTLASADSDLEQAVGEFDNSAEWRRVRVFAMGRLFRKLDFKYEQDFAADQGLKDAYFEGQLFRFSRWRLGRFKESFSLGRQTSSSNAGFLETSLPVSALTPGRGLGAMIKSNERARYSWALSMTTSAISNNNEDDPTKASLAITGRVTGTPLYGNGGKQLLHIGASYSARKPNDDTVEYATRPEARFAPVIAATPEIAADRVTLTGVELAAVSGSYWAAAEWVGSSVEAENLSNPAFDGAYLQGGWFLSGESRFYKTSSGTFGRTRPNKLYTGGNPFNIVANGGGLELTARYSALDLSGGTINAGNVRNIGFGLNWYPN